MVQKYFVKTRNSTDLQCFTFTLLKMLKRDGKVNSAMKFFNSGYINILVSKQSHL